MNNKKTVLFSGRTRKSRVDVKVFATDKNMYKSYLVYTENGRQIQTEKLGSPSGEDVTINADEGTFIKVVSAYGKATHFHTDDTFSDKIKVLSDHLLIKVPKAQGKTGMFIIDAHLGKCSMMVRDICLAYGTMRDAETTTEEESLAREVAA